MRSLSALALLRIEFLKFNRIQNWVVLSAFFLYSSSLGVLQFMALEEISGQHLVLEFSRTWGYRVFDRNANLFALLIVIISCQELTHGFFRKSVYDGLSKMDYLRAKVLLVVSLALFALIIQFLQVGISSIVLKLNPIEVLVFIGISAQLDALVILLLYGFLGLFIAFWLRKPLYGILFFLLFRFIEMILQYLQDRWFWGTLADYLPFNMISNLNGQGELDLSLLLLPIVVLGGLFVVWIGAMANRDSV